MDTTTQSPSAAPNSLVARWRRLSAIPGGRWLFSRRIGRFARYSGTIRADVRQLEPGRVVATMEDRPRVRNHLRSVHATALVTFGELASGLAMMSAMPPRTRSIVTHLEIDYLKKARGRLTAYGEAPTPDGDERREYVVTASIRDAADIEVAAVRVTWLVGPEPSSPSR